MRRVLAATTILALVPAAGAAPAGRHPRPLAGVALAGPTGLRLLVADDPPFVLDVDAGATRTLRGTPPRRHAIHEVAAVDGRGAAIVADEGMENTVYGVDGRGRSVRLGRAGHVWPAAGGAVWLQRRSGGACTLRLVGLDGRQRRVPRPFPCGARGDPPAGPLGLVVGRTRIVDPRTGRLVRTVAHGVLGAAGRTLVLAGPGRGLTVLDGATGSERRLGPPSVLAHRDTTAADPRGRYVALGFADPAWRLGGRQAVDVWVLDARTGALTQVPGLPAVVSLKRTSMAWSGDGRLVLLGEDDRRAFVAVWRPGTDHLAAKAVDLPERAGFSDTMAIVGGTSGFRGDP